MSTATLTVVYLAHRIADYRICTLSYLASLLGDKAGRLLVLTGDLSRLNREDRDRFEASGRLVEIGSRPLIRFDNKDGEAVFELHVSFRLLGWLLANKPDVVVAEGFGRWALYGFLLRIIRPTTRVITSYERTKWTERRNSWIRKSIYSALSRLVSGYFVNGKQTAELLVLERRRAPVVSGRNYTCHESFFHLPDRSAPAGTIRMFIAAQLIERKGLLELVEAISRRKDRERLAVTIAGDGPLYEKLLGRCTELGILDVVSLVGKISRDEVNKKISECHVAGLPTKEDNWSLSIVEAIAAGKPVFTTWQNGLSGDIAVDGENAILFSSDDPESIDRALERLIEVGVPGLAAMGQASKSIGVSVTPLRVAGHMLRGILSVARDGAI